VSKIRLGFRKDGDKEVSQPKTDAMSVAWQLATTKSTEAEYSAALEHECEFCGKVFERESNMYHHETGHRPTDGKPWCPLAHREHAEQAFEVVQWSHLAVPQLSRLLARRILQRLLFHGPVLPRRLLLPVSLRRRR
jgi:hypothetical protein